MKRIAFICVANVLYAWTCYRDALRPPSELYPLAAATGLLLLVGGVFGLTLLLHAKTAHRLRLLTLILILLPIPLGSYANQTGYANRQKRFEQDLPALNQLRARALQNQLPLNKGEIALPASLRSLALTAQLTGELGSRQLTVVVAGNFIGFFAYIWREDNSPPKQAQKYEIYASTPRGNGWYEAWVSNGH
ncbi:hypothetical protein [Armatimonas sp.]|uniref:hypothetical protein n=1 Tax=Armatimonas sp. TaxID=1872638 RepID=UPI0037513C0D